MSFRGYARKTRQKGEKFVKRPKIEQKMSLLHRFQLLAWMFYVDIEKEANT
jgi:hypothetical protein